MKSGVRIAAITTGPIKRTGRPAKSLLVCVIGTTHGIEGVLSEHITVDGADATQKIIKMMKGSRFGEQVRLIALNGIALAGLNLVDVEKLEKGLKVKVAIITRGRPRPGLLRRALKLQERGKEALKKKVHLLGKQRKARRIAGFYAEAELGDHAEELVRACVDLIRVSHLVSSGIARGESRGRM